MIAWAVRLGSLHLDFPRLIVGLIVLAVVAGSWSVDLWLFLAAGMWAVGRLAIGRAFPALRLHLRLERTHVFAGEWVRVEAAVANPSWWPIPWVENRREGLAAARIGGRTLRVWEVAHRGGFEIR